jgi:hypothetical protein
MDSCGVWHRRFEVERVEEEGLSVLREEGEGEEVK